MADRGWRRHYAVALIVVALATLARLAVDPVVGDRVPFATYFAAVAAVGLFAQIGAALFTTGLSAVVAAYLFVPERHSFAIATPADAVGIGLFVTSGGIVALMAGRMQRIRARLQRAADAESAQAARLATLAEISTTGLSGMRFEDLAQRIASSAAKAVGEYCIIRILHDGALDAVASAHVDPAAEPLVREIASHSNIVALNRLYADIVENPRTLVENALPEEAFAHVRRDGLEAAFQTYRARRGLFTPLLVEGRLVGTLAIGRASAEPFSPADVQFVEAIAARASLALANARLVESVRREAEEARHARAAAEAAARVKDEFLATLSHELRTPLNAILGWTHMLREPGLASDRQNAALDTILRNVQSQERLISDILDMQRIAAGKIRLHMRCLDLAEVVHTAVDTVQPSANAKNIAVELTNDAAAARVMGDPDRLQQVIWNLLVNAIKFAPRDGHVRVRLATVSDSCEIEVADNGPGIPPEFMPFVFERFRQADASTTRTHKGLGLGLAIVRNLVELHGGTVTAANGSDSGRTGAVFTIRLPLAENSAPELVA
jgi:signal transduction histidine kinase